MGWIIPVKGKPKPSGHWTDKVLRITPRCPLAGFKADLVANQGSVREKAILGKGVVHVCFHPKDPNDAAKGVCGWTWSTTVKPTKIQKQKLGINANLAYADDVSFESCYLLLLKCGCSAHADNRGPSPSPSPIWPGTGTLPRPRPRFVRNRGRSPAPVPDWPGTGTLPRPRFPSGGPRPGGKSNRHQNMRVL